MVTKEQREGLNDRMSSVPNLNGFRYDAAARPSFRPIEDLLADKENSVSHPFYPPGSKRRGIQRLRDGRVNETTKFDRLALISKLCLASFLIVVTMSVITYLVGSDQYRVETKLLFLSPEQKNSVGWPLDKELEVLRSSQLIFLLAQDLCNQVGQVPTRSLGWNLEATACGPRGCNVATPKFGSTAEFMKWFTEELIVESSVSPGRATVSLRLAGEDPEFLKTVLNAYVQRYSDYRRGLDEEAPADFFHIAGRGEPGSTHASADSITEQLQKIDFQQRECELALNLVDSRKGVFGGFFPAAKIEGIPTLAHFQQKIVELEIAKRSLSVRYTPNSREIRNIDLEMQGVKSAMRECLSEHLHFLKRGKDLLLGQKAQLESSANPGNRCGKGLCSGRLPNGDAWFSLAGGLRVIQDKPSVLRKPMLVKANEYREALSEFLSSPLGSSGVLEMEGDADCQSEVRADHPQHERRGRLSQNSVPATLPFESRFATVRSERKAH